MRVKDGCFGGVIAMDVRGVGLKALGNGSLYIYNFLENDFGGGLPTFCGNKFPPNPQKQSFTWNQIP